MEARGTCWGRGLSEGAWVQLLEFKVKVKVWKVGILIVRFRFSRFWFNR